MCLIDLLPVGIGSATIGCGIGFGLVCGWCWLDGFGVKGRGLGIEGWGEGCIILEEGKCLKIGIRIIFCRYLLTKP